MVVMPVRFRQGQMPKGKKTTRRKEEMIKFKDLNTGEIQVAAGYPCESNYEVYRLPLDR